METGVFLCPFNSILSVTQSAVGEEFLSYQIHARAYPLAMPQDFLLTNQTSGDNHIIRLIFLKEIKA